MCTVTALLEPLCPEWPHPIEVEIEVSQRCTLSQHSWNVSHPTCVDVIGAKIEVHQLPTLSHHSCKNLRILFCHITTRQLECADCPQCEVSHHDLKFFSCCTIVVGVVTETPAQEDNDSQVHLVHYLFDSL